MKWQQPRFRLDMKKFPIACARRCQLAVLYSPGMWGHFSILEMVWEKKRSYAGLRGLASLQPGSEPGSGPRFKAALTSATLLLIHPWLLGTSAQLGGQSPP